MIATTEFKVDLQIDAASIAGRRASANPFLDKLVFDSDVVSSTVESLRLVGCRFIPDPYPLQT